MLRNVPPITRMLIAVNVAVFLAETAGGDWVIAQFALWPLGTHVRLGPHLHAEFHLWQVVTYAFLHGSGMHLFLNMFGLYMFGGVMERVFGPRRFVVYYLVTVLAAAATQLAVLGVGGLDPHPTIGASGAVFGLLLAFGVLFPRRIVVLLIPPIPMPAWLFVSLFGALELYLGVRGSAEGVAHFAHLGGMLGGWLLLHRWRLRARRAAW